VEKISIPISFDVSPFCFQAEELGQQVATLQREIDELRQQLLQVLGKRRET
jgi:TolA-binding protein